MCIQHGGQKVSQFPLLHPWIRYVCPNLSSEPERFSFPPAAEMTDLYIWPNKYPLICLAFAKIRNTQFDMWVYISHNESHLCKFPKTLISLVASGFYSVFKRRTDYTCTLQLMVTTSWGNFFSAPLWCTLNSRKLIRIQQPPHLNPTSSSSHP